MLNLIELKISSNRLKISSNRLKIISSNHLVGWLAVWRIYVALAIFQPYRDLEAGDNQSLKFKWRGGICKWIKHIFKYLKISSNIRIKKKKYLKISRYLKYSFANISKSFKDIFNSFELSYQDSFYPAGIVIWNSLPQDVINADSLESFRTRISAHRFT